ncbi:MAG TPA: twin-arginine translocase TatA/TatE family subunit [Acidimicrobiia bacterium]|jgi:sec-independent protein translocase protein TatA
MDVGVPELLIILVVVLLLFGSRRLPEVARSLGEAVRELRHAREGDERDDPG